MRAKLTMATAMLIAVLAVGVSASAASAAIKYEWKAGGAPLGAGESYEVTLKNKSSEDGGKGLFLIDGGWDGIELELTSSKVKFAPATKIEGRKPGFIEGRLVFEGVSPLWPSKCAVDHGKIESDLLRAEIVESAEKKTQYGSITGTGKPLLLFEDQDGPKYEFMSITYENLGTEECSLKGLYFHTDGELLAEPSPQLKEAAVGQLLWGTAATSRNSYYLNSAGVGAGGAELSAGSSTWGFIGEPEIELTNKYKFGAF
jgi:hypothetical protein